MPTLLEMREGCADDNQSSKDALKKRVRDAMHGSKQLRNTDSIPPTIKEWDDDEEAKQREHDALVAQEKGEAGKQGRWKVRQWYGKIKSANTLKKLAALKEDLNESEEFKDGMPKRYGGDHARRDYSVKYDSAYHDEVPEHIRAKVDVDAAEKHVRSKMPADKHFDKMDSVTVHRKKDQHGTQYFGVYHYSYHTPGKGASKAFPKGQGYGWAVHHHLGTVK